MPCQSFVQIPPVPEELFVSQDQKLATMEPETVANETNVTMNCVNIEDETLHQATTAQPPVDLESSTEEPQQASTSSNDVQNTESVNHHNSDDVASQYEEVETQCIPTQTSGGEIVKSVEDKNKSDVGPQFENSLTVPSTQPIETIEDRTATRIDIHPLEKLFRTIST